ncbi:MAG: hypothetical protein GTO63_20235 [Anaerolineae bacterium]|nr:hypothetical protein [Anaerolineae bacterium]
MLREALDRRRDGKFRYPIIIFSTPVQNSKSLMSTWIGLWRFFTEKGQYMLSVANDVEQAKIILNEAKSIIRASPLLYPETWGEDGLYRDRIKNKDGNEWVVKSTEHVSTRGFRAPTIMYDELGHVTSRKQFDVLTGRQAAQVNPLLVVTSTVSGVKSGPLWDLFDLHAEGDKDIYLFYTNENLSPLIKEDYLERQRRVLPPIVYQREHENRWSEGAAALLTQADWEAALALGAEVTGRERCFLWVDIGWVHDPTTMTVTCRNEDNIVVLLDVRTFQGSHKKPVSFKALEEQIKVFHKQYNLGGTQIEAPQGVGLVEKMDLSGLRRVKLAYPTPKKHREMWGNLYSLFKQHRISVFAHEQLRKELLNLNIENTPDGFKVTDPGKIHQDHAIGLAGSALMSTEHRMDYRVAHVPSLYSTEQPILKPKVDKKPEGHNWRTCRRRTKGCWWCVQEATEEGILEPA